MRFSSSSLVATLLGAACACTAACSSDDAAETPAVAGAEAKEAALEEKLQADTGVPWKVIVERQSNAVRFLAPIAVTASATTGSSPEEKARSFFERYGADLGSSTHEQLRVKNETTDSYGHTSIRFEHVLAGTNLPIFDSSSLVEFAPDGRLLHIQPGFREDLAKVPRDATVAQAVAGQNAIDHARSACALEPADVATLKASTLGVATEPDAPALLAWAIDIRTTFGACVAPRVFVDATTGVVLRMRETASFLMDRAGGVRFHSLNEAGDIKTIDVTATTDLFGNNLWRMVSSGASPKVKTFAYSPDIINRFTSAFTSPVETYLLGNWDLLSAYRGAAVDGHYYGGKALEYFKAVHNRNGLDGKGADLTVVVHDPEPRSSGRNAHYADYGVLFNDDQLHVSDGGGDWIPLSAGFDVMTHELAHGVTNRTSGLLYQNESGALNEAFSDVMGAAAENWLPETRDAVKNVLLGERMTKDGRGIRNLADPSEDLGGGNVRDGIDHYKLMPACPGGPANEPDHCGVHTNSGIANRAFTLMVLGGLHKRSKVNVAKGIGWEKGRELWYNSFTKLGPNSNFATAAYTQLAIATTQGLESMTAVACAWFAVGVLDPADLRVRDILCAGSNPAPAPPAAAPPPSSLVGGCNGRATGYVCADGSPGFATPCNASGVTVYCADLEQQCKRASAADATATVDSSGVLTCE